MDSKDEAREETKDRILSEIKRRNSVLDALNLRCIYLSAMHKAEQTLNNKV